MAAFIRVGYAVEYVTLAPGEEARIAPNSLIEFVAVAYSPNNPPNHGWMELTFNRVPPNNGNSDAMGVHPSLGNRYTGIVKVKNVGEYSWTTATIKITRAEEINAVGPSSLLVIPENSTGNYNIVVETSDDTTTWTPFHSQTVSATDAKRFFRTRIVKAQ